MNEHEEEEEDQHVVATKQMEGFRVVIDDAQKHGEGIQNAYITYRLNTFTPDSCTNALYTTRRRYGDFEMLKSFLINEYPSCIIPPLPPKQRLDYLERFEQAFIHKRQNLLQIFIDRILFHPILRNDAAFLSFLRPEEDWKCPPNTVSEQETLLESFTDSLINAFSKLKAVDEEYASLNDRTDVYQENIGGIEKNYGKLLKAYDEYAQVLSSLATELLLSDVHETSHIDSYLKYLQMISIRLQKLVETEENGLLLTLTSQHQYCSSAKASLKLRDQKQIDYESLIEYLKQVQDEKEAIQNPGRGGASFATIFKEKYAELRGSDIDRLRQDRLRRLQEKSVELEKAIESSQEISKSFSQQLVKEFKHQNKVKAMELKEKLIKTVDGNIEFFQMALNELDKSVDEVNKFYSSTQGGN